MSCLAVRASRHEGEIRERVGSVNVKLPRETNMKLDERVKQRMEEEERDDEEKRLILFDEWMPIIERLGHPGQVSSGEMVQKLGQLGLFVLAEIAVKGKGEKTRAWCGKELAYMGGLKPVERSQNLDVHVMAEAEVDALLRSKLHELGLVERKALKSGEEERVISPSVGEGKGS